MLMFLVRNSMLRLIANKRLFGQGRMESRIAKKSMYGARDAASSRERDWRGQRENWGL